MWHLVGPRSFVLDIVKSVGRGQHVSAVLPDYLAQDVDVRSELCQSLLRVIEGARPIHVWDADLPLVEALSRQMTDDDHPPTALPDLISHPDVMGTAWVLDALDLGDRHRQELPQLLERAALESRTILAPDRVTIAIVMTAETLPRFAGQDHSDVTHAACWFWNRIARWDVAAHLAGRGPSAVKNSMTSELRAEVIVELARWNLSFASILAEEWDGTFESFEKLASTRCTPMDRTSLDGISRFRARPPDALLDRWNAGEVEVWHDDLVTAPGSAGEPATLRRSVWSAQARVLLPWIELKRNLLEREAERALGRETFRASVRAYSTSDESPLERGGVIEIGLLEKVIRYDLRRTHPDLARAAAALRNARNDLAHLTPIDFEAVEALSDQLRRID